MWKVELTLLLMFVCVGCAGLEQSACEVRERRGFCGRLFEFLIDLGGAKVVFLSLVGRIFPAGQSTGDPLDRCQNFDSVFANQSTSFVK